MLHRETVKCQIKINFNGRKMPTFEDPEKFTSCENLQEALRKSEEKYKHLLQYAPVAIFELDYKTPKFISVNDATCQLSGYNRKELLAMNPNDILDLESKKRFQDRIRKGLAGERIDENVEFTVVTKEGRIRWVIFNVKPIYRDGGLDSALVVGYDITERMKTEEALKEAEHKLKNYTESLELIVKERTQKIVESEQEYRELYESFGDAFITVDWDLKVTHWNKAAESITNVKAPDALGQRVSDILPEMNQVDISLYVKALQKNQPVHFMMNTVNRSTGQPATFEISTYPSTKGLTIIVEDKTEAENVKRLSAIGQTAGMVGHDIRNPLQAIVSDVYLLKSDLETMPACPTKNGVAESLDDIEKNITYINKIVQDLQDYAKPATPNPRETSVQLILEDVLIKKIIPDNIEANYKIAPAASKITADPIMLKRVLANLVNNAVQAMPDGGKLEVSVFRQNKRVLIIVKDNGVGIPDEFKAKLFTPLFTTKAKGQGLGLAAVKRLTEALGGTIDFKSEVGKGTEFIVSLPKGKVENK
jgi:PAS domain S-box-containing protein